MSSINLIILGYLRGKEKSAYEMVKEFESWNLSNWLKISSPSIYKNIIKLCDNGYLNSRIVKEGNMAEKTLYSMNEKGKLYFDELMEESSKDVGKVYFEFNAFLNNIDDLPKEQRNKYLMNFSKNIKERKEAVSSRYNIEKDSNKIPDSGILLLGLYDEFFSMLEKWFEKFIDYYK